MSQIEGQAPVEGQPVPGVEQVADPVMPVDDPIAEEFRSDEERMFAEEHDRRAAMERGDAPDPEPASTVLEVSLDLAPPQEPVIPVDASAPNDGAPAADPIVEKPAWYNELTDEAKLVFDEQEQSINQLQWQYTAVHGRLAPVQAQVERLQKQLSSGQPAADLSSGGQPTPTASTPVTDFESKEFLTFAKDYPDEAEAMKALFVSQQTNVQQLTRQVESLSEGFETVQASSNAQAQQVELNTLTERHPDWMQVRNSPQFESWLQTQPPSVQPLVNSKAATDCSYLLDRYKQDVYLHELNLNSEGAPAPTPEQVAADKTRQHRQSLINNPTPNPQGGGVGVPGVTGAALTAEQLWEAEVDRRLRAHKNMR